MEFAVQVDCYAGYRGEQEPRQIHLGARAVSISEIVDRWLAPDYRYFKVRGGDGGTYILRHDTESQIWQLVMYQRGSAPH